MEVFEAVSEIFYVRCISRVLYQLGRYPLTVTTEQSLLHLLPLDLRPVP